MLHGKNAIVTGARRGIGRSTVETFAKLGANIWACARKKDDTFENEMAFLSDKYGVSIWPIYFDLTNEDEIKVAVQSIHKQGFSVDILANIAGIADESTAFQMTPLEKMRHVMDVNFFSATLLTQYISRLMIRQKNGSIINVSSVAALDGEPAQYEYAACKAAIIGGTRKLARELSVHNIRVNCVAPGITDTDMGALIEPELKNRILAKVIMNRAGKPEEIANVIAFLASDMSSYITGETIRVDGGM